MPRLPIVMVNESTLRMKDVALRQICMPVDVENDLASAQALIREMFRTLYADPSGVALAAPQVGVLRQLTVISYQDRDTKENRLMALINPRITRFSDETNEDEEICLSVPNFTGKVPRANIVEVEAYDQNGQEIKFTAEGFFARVIQHELDHLNGVLYVDKAKGELDQVPDFPERRTEPTMKKLGLTHKE